MSKKYVAVGFVLSLLLGAPVLAAIGLGLVGGLVGNIDRRMIIEAQKRVGIES